MSLKSTHHLHLSLPETPPGSAQKCTPLPQVLSFLYFAPKPFRIYIFAWIILPIVNIFNNLRARWGGGGILAASLLAPFFAIAQAPPSNVEATTGPINKPAGVAYDTAGNLYIAALNDHVVRKVDLNGIITTVAGTGEEGFGGDGGPALSAQLDSPAGVALDAAGNLYIADSHNHRIREVVNGVITTIAGTGTPGFSGDGAAATAAQFNLPVAVSVDASGNVYVADANNHRIRRITGTTITTIAGNGEEAFSGDNGPATSAGLDTPNGVAADTVVPDRFYIGDTHNQRIRAVDASGIITTLAGNGTKTYTGEGSATTVAFARPRGLAVDSLGTVYLADSDNHRIRSISNGTVATVAGNGEESFSGDTGLARNAALDTPRDTAVSLTGSIALTDTNNQRIRSVALGGTTNTVAGIAPSLTESLLLAGSTSFVYGTGSLTATFANGSQTATGSLTLLEGTSTVASASLSANTSTLSLATLTPGQHTLVATYAGDAANAAIASGIYLVNVTKGSLVATANPIDVLYGQPIPTPTGTLTGVVPSDAANLAAIFSTSAMQGSPVATVPITVAVTGSAASRYTVTLAPDSGSVVIAQAGTKTALTTSNLTPNLTAPVTLTATVTSLTTGTPTGSIHFFNGSSQLASVVVSAGVATFTTAALPVGASAITAQYTGDTNFTASTSNALSETVGGSGNGDFTLTPVAATTTNAILPGTSATFHFTVAPVSPSFNLPIVFTASGLPSGATATFSPATGTLGSSSTSLTMTIQTARSSAALRLHPLLTGGSVALAFLLLPFSARWRRKSDLLRFLRLSLFVALTLGTITLVTGCGTASGFFGQAERTYTIQVTGTATMPTGTTIQHTTTVTLTIQ